MFYKSVLKNQELDTIDELYIKRTFDIARLGAGKASPNPMVGAVLVHNNKIIGEGYHKLYGTAHAEVNAVASVAKEHIPHISQATMYVSLEPCCIFGKTPPCTNLIIKNNIPKVVISNLDQTPGVNGKSVEILKDKGIKVITDIKSQNGAPISAIRNTFVKKKRPYIILKFAQSADGFMGKTEEQVWLSNPISKRLVHKWRSETDAIMVGTNTSLIDNPQLTNRLYYGPSPLRIVLDRKLRLPSSLHLMDDSQATWVITEQTPPPTQKKQTAYHQLEFNKKLLQQLMTLLYEKQKSSLLVEGGLALLKSFLDVNLWDEIRIFKTDKILHNGIDAPRINAQPIARHQILNDELLVFKNEEII